MQSYKELYVWQRAIDFVINIYNSTSFFPKTELFGLTSQMRRAAISIPANIAEGYGREHRLEYVRFIRIAFASGCELESHLIIAQKLGFLSEGEYDSLTVLLDVIMKMLNKLLSSLVTKP